MTRATDDSPEKDNKMNEEIREAASSMTAQDLAECVAIFKIAGTTRQAVIKAAGEDEDIAEYILTNF